MKSSKTTAIVMSRLPRLITPGSAWLFGLNAALKEVQESKQTLLLSKGTAGSDFVYRGACRLEIPIHFVRSTVPTTNEDESRFPSGDLAILESADRVIVLGIRSGGNLHQLLIERLKREQPVELCDLTDLQPMSVRRELVALGASLWRPHRNSECDEKFTTSAQLPFHFSQSPSFEIVPFPSRESWTFLSHTTRACAGPWPKQSIDDYIDSLLDSRPDGDHSSLSTLLRIIRQRRLIASARANRGSHNVVSLTSVPLVDLPSLHCFRGHRHRWDFEPFGISIRLEWLLARGVRPVIYGDEETWHDLNEDDRPYFQRAYSTGNRTSREPTEIDWTIEREWRHLGDIDLSDLGHSEAFLFVPSAADARVLASEAPWPITLWPDPVYAQ